MYSTVIDAYRDAFESLIADMRAQQQRFATLLAGSGALLGFVSTLIPPTSGVSRALSIATVCVLAVVLLISGFAIWPVAIDAPELRLLSDYQSATATAASEQIVEAIQTALANPGTAHLKRQRDRLFVAALLFARVALLLLVLQAFTLPVPSPSINSRSYPSTSAPQTTLAPSATASP